MVFINDLITICPCEDVISNIQSQRLTASFSMIILRTVLNCSMSLWHSDTLDNAIIKGCILFTNSLSRFAISPLKYFACSLMIILKASLDF